MEIENKKECIRYLESVLERNALTVNGLDMTYGIHATYTDGKLDTYLITSDELTDFIKEEINDRNLITVLESIKDIDSLKYSYWVKRYDGTFTSLNLEVFRFILLEMIRVIKEDI